MQQKAGCPSVDSPTVSIHERHEFRVKRVYAEPSIEDGLRMLVDRLWPRGIKKDTLPSTQWMREVAPSSRLRKWFGHEASKWTEFRRRYRLELESHPEAWQPLLTAVQKSNVTLLFAARDTRLNQAVVLKEFLDQKSGEPTSTNVRSNHE
jgi:uncharacterized protein YeaO (DUF488 family)